MVWTVDTLTLADARRLDTLWRERCATEGLPQPEIDASAQFTAHRLVDFDDDRRRGRWILLGASDADARLGGYLSAVVIPRLSLLLGTVYVDELYVLPAQRRKGAGRALLTALVDLARRRGAARVQVPLDPNIAGLERLVKQVGFEDDIIEWGVYRLG
jgi:GNAT superfamily N-acetyltransferase